MLLILVLGSGNTGLARAESPPPAQPGRHLFILSGQSNMRSPLPDTFEAVVSKVFGKDHVTVATFSVPSQPIRLCLNTGINPWSGYENDGEHFPNPGYRVLGQRLARTACKQIDPLIKLDEAIFDARFFNTVDEILVNPEAKAQASIKSAGQTQNTKEHTP